MLLIISLLTAHAIAGYFTATLLLKPQRLSDVLLTACLLAFTTFYLLPIVIGATTSYINTATVIFSALVAVGIAWYGYYKSEAPKACLQKLILRAGALPPASYALVVLIAAYLILTFWVGSALPIRAWDAASYHVVGPMRWVQSGRFILDSFGDPFAYPYLAAAESYPNVKAVLPFVVMLWTENIAGTALAQWPYLVLLVVALYAFYRRLEIPHTLSFVAIFFCLTAPEVMLQSVEAYADVAYFAGVICVMWSCLVTWQDWTSNKSLLYSALSFSVLVGTKPTALLTCAVLGSCYLVIVLLRTEGKLQVRARQALIALVSVLLISLATAGPWYIHALRALNNPVYPIEVTLFGKTLFEGPYPPSMNADFIKLHTQLSGIDAWWAMITEKWRPPTLASWSGGLGAAAFILGFPCFIAYVLTLGFRPRVIDNMLICLLFLLLVATSQALALGRFFMFALGLGGLAIASVGAYVHVSVRVLLICSSLALGIYNIYVTVPSILYRPRPADLVTFDLVSGYPRTAKMDTFPGDYNVFDYWIDKVASAEYCVAIEDSITAWSLFDPTEKANIVRIPDTQNETIQAWTLRAKENGATHVCLLRSSRLFADAIRADGILRLLYWDIHGPISRAPFMPDPVEGALFEIKSY